MGAAGKSRSLAGGRIDVVARCGVSFARGPLYRRASFALGRLYVVCECPDLRCGERERDSVEGVHERKAWSAAVLGRKPEQLSEDSACFVASL